MKLNLERILFATAAVCALVTVSCKKEEPVTTLKYFSGTIRVNLPAYVEPGQTIHLSPGDLKKEDGSTAIGFYWKIKENEIVCILIISYILCISKSFKTEFQTKI